MNAKTIVLTSFVGSVALITYRDYKAYLTGGTDWPLPAPPPYRYAAAGMAYGLLAIVADTLSDKVAAVIAVGLFLGLGYQLASNRVAPPPTAGLPSVGGTQPNQPNQSV